MRSLWGFKCQEQSQIGIDTEKVGFLDKQFQGVTQKHIEIDDDTKKISFFGQSFKEGYHHVLTTKWLF